MSASTPRCARHAGRAESPVFAFGSRLMGTHSLCANRRRSLDRLRFGLARVLSPSSAALPRSGRRVRATHELVGCPSRPPPGIEHDHAVAGAAAATRWVMTEPCDARLRAGCVTLCGLGARFDGRDRVVEHQDLAWPHEGRASAMRCFCPPKAARRRCRRRCRNPSERERLFNTCASAARASEWPTAPSTESVSSKEKRCCEPRCGKEERVLLRESDGAPNHMIGRSQTSLPS